MQRASARALNRVATSTRKEATRIVRETLNLKSGDVKDQITTTRVKSKTSLSAQSFDLVIAQKGVPLVQYGAKDKKVKTDDGPRFGVTVKVKKKGQRKLVTGGFLADTRGGVFTIFKRTGDARLPIKLQYGPSVRDAFKAKAQVKALLGYAREVLAKTLRRELSFELQKQKQK